MGALGLDFIPYDSEWLVKVLFNLFNDVCDMQEADEIRSDMDAAHQKQFDEFLRAQQDQIELERSAMKVQPSRTVDYFI